MAFEKEEARDWELFMDTAKEAVEDFKLLVSGVSEERLRRMTSL